MPGKPNHRQRDEKRRLTESEHETLHGLLERLKIPADKWDFLLIGDGSGSNFSRACGWATVSIERVTGERRLWFGNMNLGTVNIAEMLAYVQPLSWLVNRERNIREEGGPFQAFQIYIITDSEYVSNSVKTPNRVVKMNASLWSMFDSFVREGFILHSRHVRRNEAALNNYVDAVSKSARKAAESYNVEETAGVTANMYDVNPSE